MQGINSTINDRYDIKTLLGRGGMGNVYLAFDRETKENVAIKHLKSEFVSDTPEIVERFTREAEILRQLDHPNIVDIRDSIIVGDEHYIVMDYIDGGSLDRYMKNNEHIPLDRVLEIGLDLADALTRAHRLKIIHRDIKPANVLMTKSGKPLLTDFGVAHVADRTRVTEAGSVIGTYAYLSPEACQGQELDERADIWSFGVVLYELISGQRPFHGDQPAHIITRIMSETPQDLSELRPDVSPPLVELVMWMLDKDRDQRIATVRRVGTELESILEGLDTTPRPATANDQASSRFSTTPPPVADEGTIQVSTHGPSALSGTPTPVLDAESTITSRNLSIALPWIALIVLILAVSGVILALILVGGNGDEESPTVNNPQAEVIASLIPANRARSFEVVTFEGDPVPPNAVLVLVADLENIDTIPQNMSRFILDDLVANVQANIPQRPIYVRHYPRVVSNASQALQAAEANEAAMMIWGFYTDEFVQVETTLGVLEPAFPYNQFERQQIENLTNLRIRYNDVFNETISYQVLNSIILYHVADGNAFETLRLSLAISQISAPAAAVIGDSAAAILYRGSEALWLQADLDAYLESIETALQRDPNPLIYISRAVHRLSTGDLEGMAQDVETAQRLAPPAWTMPQFLTSGVTGDKETTRAELSTIIDLRPDDWYAHYNRGTAYFFEQDYENARIDFDNAIALNPPANFPYVFGALIAMRDGRFNDMLSLLQTVAREFPDPNYSERLIQTTFTNSTFQLTNVYVSTVTNLVLAQYDAVIEDVDELVAVAERFSFSQQSLAIADLYFLKGLAHCSIGEYELAEMAYDAAVDLEPDFWLVYYARLEVNEYQEDAQGIQEDVTTLLSADLHPQLDNIVQLQDAAELSCSNYFSFDISALE